MPNDNEPVVSDELFRKVMAILLRKSFGNQEILDIIQAAIEEELASPSMWEVYAPNLGEMRIAVCNSEEEAKRHVWEAESFNYGMESGYKIRHWKGKK